VLLAVGEGPAPPAAMPPFDAMATRVAERAGDRRMDLAREVVTSEQRAIEDQIGAQAGETTAAAA
jgi:hypothetical protein